MKHLAINLLLALTAAAAPTQIRDTAYTGFTGVLFTGRITITGSEMTTRGGRTIHRWEQSLTISNGIISLDLEPNEGASPPGTSYLVVYRPTSGQSWSERWVVPASVAPVTVGQVRAPASYAAVLPEQIKSAGATPGQCLVWDGREWAPGDCRGVTGFSDGEAPLGVSDGVNRLFQLAQQPQPSSSLVLVRNGMIQRVNLDYTLSGNVVSFTTDSTPQDGDLLQAWYRFGAQSGGWSDAETPAGALDGVNATFLLANAPWPAASLVLTRNGVVLKAGADFTLVGGAITFAPEATPEAGDVLQAWYRY